MAASLAVAGVEPIVQPLLRAEPTEAPLPEDCFHHVIFVSEHAVAHAVGVVKALADGAQWYAIGPATAQALTKLFKTQVGQSSANLCVPALARSEGLLEEPSLQAQALGGARNKVLLVAGEAGRELIADTLKNRGAVVTTWLVYRRKKVETGVLTAAGLAGVDVCIASSGSGLELLTDGWFAAGGSAAVPVCVPSPRIADMAVKLGWQTPVLCDGASAEATLQGLVDAGLLDAHSVIGKTKVNSTEE